MPGADDDSMRIEVPADPRFLRVVRLASSAVGSMVGFDVDDLDDLRLVVDELCSAALDAGAGPVLSLVVRWADGALALSVTSGGAPNAGAVDAVRAAMLSAMTEHWSIDVVDGQGFIGEAVVRMARGAR